MKQNRNSKKQAPGARRAAGAKKVAPQAAHMVSIGGTAKRSRLEVLFLRGWEHQGGPELVEEHAFAEKLAPGAVGAGRLWRFDFAHLPTKTAFEIDGGTFSRGRHNQGSGSKKDYEKFLAAHLAGWRVVRLTGSQISAVVIAGLIAELRGRMGSEVSAGSRGEPRPGIAGGFPPLPRVMVEPGWILEASKPGGS